MKPLLATLLTALLALGQTFPASASEGGKADDPVEAVVNRIALTVTMSQLLFTPDQIVLLSPEGAFGMAPPDDVEKIDEPGGGGLFGKLFDANKRKIFKDLARENFLKKVGRAYKIGNMVFVDSVFFNTDTDNEATAAGRAALNSILNGGTFALGQAADPFAAIMGQQLLAMVFLMRATEGMNFIYRLNPKMNETGDIVGVTSGAALTQPLAMLAFFAALKSGAAQPLGDVWEIKGKFVIAAPLEELFPAE